jgi:5,10-methylenetetrahydromethanopterin reductase
MPTEYYDQAMEQIKKGARRTNRTIDQIERTMLIVCSVDEDREKAMDASRALLTQYLAQQPHFAKANKVSPKVVEKIQSILGWPATYDEIQRAKVFVPDDLLDRITASGTPAQARARIDEYMKQGAATIPVIYPLGDVRKTIDAFSPLAKG